MEQIQIPVAVETHRFITPREAADICGVTTNVLALWRHHRRGPRYWKVGRNVRYDFEETHAWVNSNVRECDPTVEGMYRR